MQRFSKDLRGESKAIKPAGDSLQRRRLCHLFSVKVSAMIRSSLGYVEGLEGRMVDIETVDIADVPAIFLEQGGEIEESQGLGPEVIGGEVVHPGVDQEEIILFSLQPFSSIAAGGNRRRQDPCKGWDSGLPFLMVKYMEVGMRVRLTFMPVAMYMYEVVGLKQLAIFQDLPRTA